MTVDVQTRQAVANGAEFNYVEQGSGEPVIFVHGNTVSSSPSSTQNMTKMTREMRCSQTVARDTCSGSFAWGGVPSATGAMGSRSTTDSMDA